MAPTVYIIAGPNGAGKTTFAREFLPHYASCDLFVNADLIAQGLSPFFPEAAAVRAARLMLAEIDRNLARRRDFSFESTLSGHSYLSWIRNAQNLGYGVHILYLWLPSVDLALTRIRRRVAEGGHNIPEPVARRRFTRSIHNFLCLYRQVANSWILHDNSGATPSEIARQWQGESRIIESELFEKLIQRYGRR